MLCVECEEKKWRGQLRPMARQGKIPSAVAAAPKSDPKPEARAFAAAAQSSGAPAAHRVSPTVTASAGAATALPAVQGERGKMSAGKVSAAAAASKTPGHEATIKPAAQKLEIPSSVASSDRSSVQSSIASPGFVFSAGLEPSQSWLGVNKYIVGVLLVVAAVVTAVFLLR
jgi:hypothetical protein